MFAERGQRGGASPHGVCKVRTEYVNAAITLCIIFFTKKESHERSEEKRKLERNEI